MKENTVDLLIRASERATTTVEQAGKVLAKELSHIDFVKVLENLNQSLQDSLYSSNSLFTSKIICFGSSQKLNDIKTAEELLVSFDKENSVPIIGLLSDKNIGLAPEGVIHQLSLFETDFDVEGHFNTLNPLIQGSCIHTVKNINPLIVVNGVLEKFRNRRIHIDDLHWRELEELVAELLERGSWKVEVTRRTNDGGADVIATRESEDFGFCKTIWQAKKNDPRKKVGIGVIRELADTRQEMRATKAYIVTTSFLTQPALKRIERDRSILGKKERNDLGKWINRVLEGEASRSF